MCVCVCAPIFNFGELSFHIYAHFSNGNFIFFFLQVCAVCLDSQSTFRKTSYCDFKTGRISTIDFSLE